MCFNTKTNIMKIKVGHPDLGSRGKYLCLFVLYFMLSLLFIFCFKDSFVDNFCTGLKPTILSPYKHVCTYGIDFFINFVS